MDKKRDSLSTAMGVIMMIAGGLGIIFWLVLLLLGVLLSGGGHPDYTHENTIALEYAIPVVLALIGAIFSLITGIVIVRKKRADGGNAIKVLIIATAILYLPAIVMLSIMYWFFASIPALLFGLAPPVVLLIKNKGR